MPCEKPADGPRRATSSSSSINSAIDGAALEDVHHASSANNLAELHQDGRYPDRKPSPDELIRGESRLR